jgi:large subunit ribosomal protein L25
MAKPQTLKATERNRTGSGVLKQMRREGFVPSVIYGGGVDNKNVKVDSKTFKDMLKNAASDSILVNLDVEGAGTQLAFLQDVQHDAITGAVLHVDFLAVDEKTEIHASLPLGLTGECLGEAQGGFLDQMLHNLEISCRPQDLPESISADVAHLDVGDALHIGDITFPEGVKPILNADVVVALVIKARTPLSEDEEAAEGEGEVEVINEAAPAE